MQKRSLVLVLVLMISLIFTGCANKTKQTAVDSSTLSVPLVDDARLEIVGDGISITLSADEMRTRARETLNCTNINSFGDVAEEAVTGFSLDMLLAENGIEMTNVVSLNFIASDGYVMAAPADLYADNPIYILLKRYGENLEHPVSCLPDQRAMYWVKELVKIEVELAESSLQQANNVKKISLFREAINEITAVELLNDGQKVAAFSLKTFFKQYASEMPSEPVKIIARDGHEKTETAEVLLSAHVTLEAKQGEEGNLPFYFSEEMKQGMRVKQLDAIISQSDAVYFGKETSVIDLFGLVAMEEKESYKFIASDGFVSEIPAAAIPFGKIYFDEEQGYLRSSFDAYDLSNLHGGGQVMHLVAIEGL